jgi:hypothetical protein
MVLLGAHIMRLIIVELEMDVHRRLRVRYQLKFECLLLPVVAQPTDVFKDRLRNLKKELE